LGATKRAGDRWNPQTLKRTPKKKGEGPKGLLLARTSTESLQLELRPKDLRRSERVWGRWGGFPRQLADEEEDLQEKVSREKRNGGSENMGRKKTNCGKEGEGRGQKNVNGYDL